VSLRTHHVTAAQFEKVTCQTNFRVRLFGSRWGTPRSSSLCILLLSTSALLIFERPAELTRLSGSMARRDLAQHRRLMYARRPETTMSRTPFKGGTLPCPLLNLLFRTSHALQRWYSSSMVRSIQDNKPRGSSARLINTHCPMMRPSLSQKSSASLFSGTT
jgi:hypothetical protein